MTNLIKNSSFSISIGVVTYAKSTSLLISFITLAVDMPSIKGV